MTGRSPSKSVPVAKRHKKTREDTPRPGSPQGEHGTESRRPASVEFTSVSPPTLFTTPTSAQPPYEESPITTVGAKESVAAKKPEKPVSSDDPNGSPTVDGSIMCAQRQDEEHRDDEDRNGPRTAQERRSGGNKGKEPMAEDDSPENETKKGPHGGDGGPEEAPEPTGTDGPLQTARDPRRPPASERERELDLPAGASRDAAAMIEAELRRRAMEPEEAPRPEMASDRPMAVSGGGTARGVMSAPGSGLRTCSEKRLRSGQHRTVSRVSGRMRPTEEVEAIQALRAELLKNPGIPGQRRPSRRVQPARSGSATPESLPDQGVFTDSEHSADEEEDNGARATATLMTRVRDYDEMAYNTARNCGNDPWARAEVLSRLYTPEYKSRLGKMDWHQIAARVSRGFPMDRPVFEEAFPFHKWNRWMAGRAAANRAAAAGEERTAPMEVEFPSVEYSDNPAALRTAGHTPRRGCSPVQDGEMTEITPEEELGVNTAERVARPERHGGPTAAVPQLLTTDTQGK